MMPDYTEHDSTWCTAVDSCHMMLSVVLWVVSVEPQAVQPLQHLTSYSSLKLYTVMVTNDEGKSW